VFITGENGTGKVKAAAAIHDQSGYKDGAFVKLDCSTAAPNTIEAELLGHIAMPGAPEKDRRGRVGQWRHFVVG
jgi:two-component system repressor protein LuxO